MIERHRNFVLSFSRLPAAAAAARLELIFQMEHERGQSETYALESGKLCVCTNWPPSPPKAYANRLIGEDGLFAAQLETWCDCKVDANAGRGQTNYLLRAQARVKYEPDAR